VSNQIEFIKGLDAKTAYVKRTDFEICTLMETGKVKKNLFLSFVLKNV